jgi:hypothetical protein
MLANQLADCIHWSPNKHSNKTICFLLCVAVHQPSSCLRALAYCNECNSPNKAESKIEENGWGAVSVGRISQRSLHDAPIFRLLLKVAVNGTHQCDFLNFCGPFKVQHTGAWQQTKTLTTYSWLCELWSCEEHQLCHAVNSVCVLVGRSSQAVCLLRNSAMDDSIGGS